MHQHLPREFPFELPRLKARRIAPDGSRYRSAPRNRSAGWDGMLLDGEWHLHIYSDGCREEQNPTSIEAVRDHLEQSLAEALAR